MPRFVVRTVIACAVLVAVLLGKPGALAAQSGTVQGKVTDSAGAAIPGAIVTIDHTGLRVAASGTGKYVIHGVPKGGQTLQVRAIGFSPTSVGVTIVGADVIEQNVVLSHSAVELAPIDVVIGSRGKHTTAEELAVPVDVYTSEDIKSQGTTETSQILAALSPSVNFPHQTVTDGTDIVRPFTMRGLSPDHTLVLVNGWRRHQTALLNTFPLGSNAGSSGVDLNAIPGSAIERVEVLRDGASSQYGSDAIAGVVNIVMKEGQFSPFISASGGQYMTGKGYKDDGTTVDVNGGVGIKLGRGSLGLFGEFQNRQPTNRAFPDGSFTDLNGLTDSVDVNTGEIIIKRTGLPQPVNHLGDGLERDLLSFANLRMPLNASGSSEFYAFGGYSNRVGTGNGYYRKPLNNRNWPEIYPYGFLPEFRPDVNDYSAVAGVRTGFSGWALDFGGSYGRNTFDYKLRNTLNPSLGPCLDVACAPGADGIFGNADDPGIPNQTTFDAGSLKRGEFILGLNLAKPIKLGLPNPVSVALGGTYRRETYDIVAGETASWINGNHQSQDSVANPGAAPAGSSVFSGFSPNDASSHSRSNVGGYLELESDLSKQVLLNIAGRYEHYSDFGSRVTGKAALRVQPSKRVVIRGAASTGFRAPGLSQSYFSHVTTNFSAGHLVEIGNFPVTNRASQIFGAKKLRDETSVNLSGGIAFSPADNFTVTVDVFHVAIKHRILLGATYDGSVDTVVARILADSGFTTIGGVQFATNGLDTKTQGIDLTGDLRLPLGGGTLDLNAGVNYTKNTITHLDGLPAILQNTATSYTGTLDLISTLALTRERPDWRGTLTATWSTGRFHALGRGSYYGSGKSAEFGGVVGEVFAAKTLFDTEIGYRFNQIDLSIGARNIFDTYPSRMKDLDNNNNYTFPWAVASPFGYNGRFVYTRADIVLGW